MGGVVALALAGGLFGVDVIAAIGIGIKVVWTPEELAWASALATRPIKWFEDGAEAEAFFLRVSGLEGLATPGGELAASGVVAEGGRYRLAADPAGALVGAPPMASLMAAASAPVHLACGTRDHLTSVEQLRRFDPGATELPGLGHNAHVEDPERTWGFVAQTLG